MGATIKFNSKLNVIFVDAAGELNNENAALIVERALKVIDKHKCKKIFCDFCDTKVTSSSLEIYEIPILFDLWEVPYNVCISVVYSQDEKSFKFWEARMQKAGFIARVFKEKSEALKWLTEIE
jgi:hypothetical protein